jgi:hypothetical protein
VHFLLTFCKIAQIYLAWKIAKKSKVLRKEGKLISYENIDFILAEGYNKNNTMKAMTNASRVVSIAKKLKVNLSPQKRGEGIQKNSSYWIYAEAGMTKTAFQAI